MLNRRAFLCGAVSATLAMLLDTEAPPAMKLHRIGVFSPETPPGR